MGRYAGCWSVQVALRSSGTHYDLLDGKIIICVCLSSTPRTWYSVVHNVAKWVQNITRITRYMVAWRWSLYSDEV